MKGRRFPKSFLANPPFNVSDWYGERLREDKQRKFGKLVVLGLIFLKHISDAFEEHNAVLNVSQEFAAR